MIRVQLDLVFPDDGSPANHAAVSLKVDELTVALAEEFGLPGILKWSVAPLPQLRLSMEPVQEEETDA